MCFGHIGEGIFITIKALFVDFYGTLVHEDDEIIPVICEQIRVQAEKPCTSSEIGKYWWKTFSEMVMSSYGNTFETQRYLGLKSLQNTLDHYLSTCVAEEIIQPQFAHWQRPKLFADTRPFLSAAERIPVYILSNIDSEDVIEAVQHHRLEVNGILSSEDVRSYKPRPELFEEALRIYGLKREEVLHIGDSLTNDVAGAQGVDIQAVWLNRKQKQKPETIQPDYECASLMEVIQIW